MRERGLELNRVVLAGAKGSRFLRQGAHLGLLLASCSTAGAQRQDEECTQQPHHEQRSPWLEVTYSAHAHLPFSSLLWRKPRSSSGAFPVNRNLPSCTDELARSCRRSCRRSCCLSLTYPLDRLLRAWPRYPCIGGPGGPTTSTP